MAFRWRRRNEGFEWRTYVRTTILLRRENRRRQADEVKAAAVFGIKQAGQKSVDAASNGFKAAGHAGKAVLQRAGAHVVRGAKSLTRSAGSVSYAAWLKGRTLAGRGRERLSPGFGAFKKSAGNRFSNAASSARSTFSVAELVREPRALIRPMLWILAATAIAASVVRAWQPGSQLDALIPAIVAVAILAYLIVPGWLAARDMGPVTAVKGAAHKAGEAASWFGSRRVTVPLPAVIGLGLALVAALIYWPAPSSPGGPAPSFWTSSGLATVSDYFYPKPLTVAGSATAVSGDTLRIGSTTLKLDGIEAPSRSQTCSKPGRKQWDCAEDARSALSKSVKGKNVVCTVTANDDATLPLATCLTGDTDIAAILVRDGRVFATGGLLSAYGAQESEAKTLRAGLWVGDAKRPSEWREARWEEAKRKAPDGCPIKGQVLSRTAKIYVLPWSSRYDSARIDLSRGDRWFCSEEEAQTAGWKPSQKS